MDFEEFWARVKVIGTFFALICVVIVFIAALSGAFGPLFNQIDNANFNSSQQHQDAVVGIFTSDCRQIAQAKDQQTKLALENDITENAGHVDLDKLTMSDYTRTCVNTAIADVNNQK